MTQSGIGRRSTSPFRRWASALAVVVVCSQGVALPAAEAVEYLGDNRLVVDAHVPCPSYEEPLCGPVLSMRTSEMPDDDTYTLISRGLAGPAGAVPMGYAPDFSKLGDSFDTDPDYQGYRLLERAPTGLPAGRYTYTIRIERPAHWGCSIYDPHGCSWEEEIDTTYAYNFEWAGADATEWPYVAPAAPRALKVIPRDGSAIVRWSEPIAFGSEPPTGYAVYGSSGSRVCTTPNTWCVVRGLSNGKAYRFSVRVTHNYGVGPRSISPTVTPSPFLISRVYYDSPGADTGSNRSLNGEYVRIVNVATTARSLSGWALRNAQGATYRFGTRTVAPGASVTVRTGHGMNTTAFVFWNKPRHMWSNSRDTAYLAAPGQRLMSTCSWSAAGAGFRNC